MKIVLIIIGGLFLLFVLVVFGLYWFIFRAEHRVETLVETEHRGLRIRIRRDFYKAKVGSDSQTITWFLNGKKAAETGSVWKGWGNEDARPLPVHREDLARVVARRTFFADSLYDDGKYRNLWIRPQRFSREQFDKLADFLRQHQGEANPPFSPLMQKVPYFVANLFYGDPDPMQPRSYTRNGDKALGSIDVRMDGAVDYNQCPCRANIGEVIDGGDTLVFEWNRGGGWAGADTERLTVDDLALFRNEQGEALNKRYHIRQDRLESGE